MRPPILTSSPVAPTPSPSCLPPPPPPPAGGEVGASLASSSLQPPEAECTPRLSCCSWPRPLSPSSTSPTGSTSSTTTTQSLPLCSSRCPISLKIGQNRGWDQSVCLIPTAGVACFVFLQSRHETYYNNTAVLHLTCYDSKSFEHCHLQSECNNLIAAVLLYRPPYPANRNPNNNQT